MSRNFFRLLTRVHKWAGLIIGLQILFWIGSGVFMTTFPIEKVRGEHLVSEKPAFTFTDNLLIPIDLAMTAYGGQVTSVKLISIAERPAYVLLGDKGSRLLDARTGEDWTDLAETEIRQAAQKTYQGEGEIASIAKLKVAPKDYRGDLPVWQVRFDDSAKTRLYIDPQTADIRATRTRLWRVFDLMWKFHIMDVTGEDNFNSWWLRLAAIMALLFTLSGFALLWHRFVMRPRPKRQRS